MDLSQILSRSDRSNISLADASALLRTDHAPLRSSQMLVDTAPERGEAELSDAASSSAWKPPNGKWLPFKSELESAGRPHYTLGMFSLFGGGSLIAWPCTITGTIVATACISPASMLGGSAPLKRALSGTPMTVVILLIFSLLFWRSTAARFGGRAGGRAGARAVAGGGLRGVGLNKSQSQQSQSQAQELQLQSQSPSAQQAV